MTITVQLTDGVRFTLDKVDFIEVDGIQMKPELLLRLAEGMPYPVIISRYENQILFTRADQLIKAELAGVDNDLPNT